MKAPFVNAARVSFSVSFVFLFFGLADSVKAAEPNTFIMASQLDDSHFCPFAVGVNVGWRECFLGSTEEAWTKINLGKGSALGSGTIHSVTVALDPSSLREYSEELYGYFFKGSWIIYLYCFTDDTYSEDKLCPDWIAGNAWNAGLHYLLGEWATSTDNKYWTSTFDNAPAHGTNFDGSFPVRFNPNYYYQLRINDNGWPVSAYGSQTLRELYWILRGIKDEPTCTENCYSNVLFLPGLKGSVLKFGSDTLWPPGILSADIPKLALATDGTSVNNVTVEGIVETFYNVPIYSSFSSFMNSLVSDGTINEWEPLPYDWRYSPEQVVENGIKTANGSVDVIEKIEQLAANSKSGKVAIVAHSMGGLVGKSIIKKLEEQGKADLIDSFVMIGVPQLGTPQAITSLLHGDGEAIPNKIFLPTVVAHPANVRAIAQNFQSAYDLLPSPRYFEEVVDPPIIFDSSASFTSTWRAYWGQTLDSLPEFKEFLTGLGVTRTNPAVQQLHIPEILRADLVENAVDFHAEYDNYQFPESIRVVQVAGWGVPTIKAVEYTVKHNLQTYEPVFTREGDSTVVYPSALASRINKLFFNIFDYNERPGIVDASHKDLLSADPISSLTLSVVTNTPIETEFISSTKPSIADLDDQLLISTHSPVVLGVYDSLGNFTGIDPNQNLSSEVLTITENIPGSTFQSFGESQYIFLPKEGSYTFVFKGVGTGPTTVEIENFSNDTATPIAVYSDIPITPSTKATFVINSATPTSTEIEVDSNGDNQVDDIVVADGAELTLEKLLTLLKTKIQNLDSKVKLKKELLAKVKKIEQKIVKQKQKKASKALMSLGKKILKKVTKSKISDAEAQEILKILEEIEHKL